MKNYNDKLYNDRNTQHELGHAEALYKSTSTKHPIYVSVCGGKSITVSYAFQELIEAKDYDKIIKIAKAGLDRESEYMHNTYYLPKALYKKQVIVATRIARCFNHKYSEGDHYWSKHPEKFTYISVHSLSDIRKKNLYLYSNGELQKIDYSPDLPEKGE